MKRQTPNPKFQRSSKDQAPRGGGAMDVVWSATASVTHRVSPATELRQTVAHGVSRGSVSGDARAAEQRQNRSWVVASQAASAAPLGLAPCPPFDPRLTPWATGFRCSAAPAADWSLELGVRPSAFWTALAERSGDSALASREAVAWKDETTRWAKTASRERKAASRSACRRTPRRAGYFEASCRSRFIPHSPFPIPHSR